MDLVFDSLFCFCKGWVLSDPFTYQYSYHYLRINNLILLHQTHSIPQGQLNKIAHTNMIINRRILTLSSNSLELWMLRASYKQRVGGINNMRFNVKYGFGQNQQLKLRKVNQKIQGCEKIVSPNSKPQSTLQPFESPINYQNQLPPTNKFISIDNPTSTPSPHPLTPPPTSPTAPSPHILLTLAKKLLQLSHRSIQLLLTLLWMGAMSVLSLFYLIMGAFTIFGIYTLIKPTPSPPTKRSLANRYKSAKAKLNQIKLSQKIPALRRSFKNAIHKISTHMEQRQKSQGLKVVYEIVRKIRQDRKLNNKEKINRRRVHPLLAYKKVFVRG